MLALALGIAAAHKHGVFAADKQAARPKLQRVLERLVSGNERIAPGASAIVSGPRGSWSGAAGVADAATNEPMRPNTRVRLESVSKAWTAALVLSLVEEGRIRLDDPVERWLPDLLPAGKRAITVRQLLSHTSGLVDSNDITHDPEPYLAKITDRELSARVEAVVSELRRDRGFEFPALLWVELAAALPLAYPPSETFHYSNIGFALAGLVAERAGGDDLAALVEERIARPLGLESAAYDPHSEITGDHARGYNVADDGTLTDATRWTLGLGADGGIVSDAADEARFLTALMSGRLLGARSLKALRTPSAVSGDYGLGIGVSDSGCLGPVYGHNGGSDGYETNVSVSGDGSRVAVLLLNGRKASSTSGDATALAALREFYCAA